MSLNTASWVKRVFSVIAAIAVLSGIIFGINAYEAKFATAEDIKQVRQDIVLLGERLEQKILSDRAHSLQQRIWSLEDHYGGAGVPQAPSEVKENYRELKYDLKLLLAKIHDGGNP